MMVRALLLLATLIAADTAAAHDHGSSRGRLVFADQEKAVIRVLDLDSGDVTHTFETSRVNPAFATSHDGRYVFVLTGDASGTINVLDTGLVAEPHGDHVHVEKRDVRMLGLGITGERLSHVASAHGWASFFYDGPREGDRATGTKVVLLHLTTLDSKQRRMRVRFLADRHHGLAVPLGNNHWAITSAKRVPLEAGGNPTSLPDGFAVYHAGKEWTMIRSFADAADGQSSCKELHGHGSAQNVHVFGCNLRSDGDPRSDGGLLVLGRDASGSWTSRKLRYPDERRATTIKSREDAAYMIANYGRGRRYDALLRVDPKASTLSLETDVFAAPGGQAICRFDLASDGRRVANLLPDGTLRVYEIAPVWREVARFDAVMAFDCSPGSSAPQPALAIVGRSAFVSDPSGHRIREYDLVTLKPGLDIPVEGVPGAIAPGAGE